MNPTSILQWNAQGLRHKKDELLELIHDYRATLVAIQETKLTEEYNIRIPNYNVISKSGHYNRGQHGGVTLYIHSDIPYNEIPLSTTLQAIAVEVHTSFRFSICNVYASRSHDLTRQKLQHILNQIPQPCLFVGDFNAYGTSWGAATSDERGKDIEDFLENNDLILLNYDAPTRIGYNSETTIDLSFCSPSIALQFSWNILPTTLSSDHCPIIIYMNTECPPVEASWKMKDANWDLFESSSSWRNLPEVTGDNQLLLDNLYQRFNQACQESIPVFTPKRFFPKPWWYEDLSTSKQRREIFYQQYRHNKTVTNLLNWKKARATHKNKVKIAKEKNWKEYISQLKFDAPMSLIYDKMRKIKGKPITSIHILQENGIKYTNTREICNKIAESFSQISSSTNYNQNFLQFKENSERNPHNFGHNRNEYYNRKFTLDELQTILATMNDSSPGHDRITYSMIKH